MEFECGKLKPNWQKPEQTLRAIRRALPNLYKLLDQEEERKDPDALRDFFSIPDSGFTPADPPDDPPVDPPVDPPQAGSRYFQINKRRGGVSITPGPDVRELSFPKSVQVKIAFDMFGANPFGRHSPYDFDLRTEDIDLEYCGVEVEVKESNSIDAAIQDVAFFITLSGFDQHRDLIVKIDDTDADA